MDITFWDANKNIIGNDSPLETLLAADSVMMKIDNQENGTRGGMIHHNALHTKCCPIQALARHVQTITNHPLGHPSKAYQHLLHLRPCGKGITIRTNQHSHQSNKWSVQLAWKRKGFQSHPSAPIHCEQAEQWQCTSTAPVATPFGKWDAGHLTHSLCTSMSKSLLSPLESPRRWQQRLDGTMLRGLSLSTPWRQQPLLKHLTHSFAFTKLKHHNTFIHIHKMYRTVFTNTSICTLSQV